MSIADVIALMAAMNEHGIAQAVVGDVTLVRGGGHARHTMPAPPPAAATAAHAIVAEALAGADEPETDAEAEFKAWQKGA